MFISTVFILQNLILEKYFLIFLSIQPLAYGCAATATAATAASLQATMPCCRRCCDCSSSGSSGSRVGVVVCGGAAVATEAPADGMIWCCRGSSLVVAIVGTSQVQGIPIPIIWHIPGKWVPISLQYDDTCRQKITREQPSHLRNMSPKGAFPTKWRHFDIRDNSCQHAYNICS